MKRNRLVGERTKRNLTQADLAEKIDISTIYVRKLESGSVKPGRETMIKYEKFFGLSSKTLFPDIFLSDNDKKVI